MGGGSSGATAAIAEAVEQMRALIAREGAEREFDCSGYHCLIVRDPDSGFLSGYVGLPSTHPYYGVDRSEVEEITVHGGISSSGSPVGSDRGLAGRWYLGFDCNHFDDLCLRDLESFDSISLGVKRSASYKSMEFVEQEVRSFAEQLKRAEHKRIYR